MVWSAKETRVFNGKSYVMEPALYGDFALIKAYKVGGLGFRTIDVRLCMPHLAPLAV